MADDSKGNSAADLLSLYGGQASAATPVVPQGNSADDLLSLYGQQASAAPAPTPAPQPQAGPPQWSDLPGNILPSAKAMVGNMVTPFIHPIDTAKGIYNIATDPKARSAVADFYKQRYGGLDNLHDTLIKDPVGAVSDLATVLTGGAALAERAPGIVGELASTVGKVGSAIDPVANAGRALSVAGDVTGTALGSPLAWTLGKTTLTGTDAVKTAFKAGQEGGAEGKAFLGNLRGNVKPTAVLDDVSHGINQIKSAAQNDYKANFPQSSVPMDVAPIHDAYDNFVNTLKTPEGKLKISDDEWNKVQGLKTAIDDATTTSSRQWVPEISADGKYDFGHWQTVKMAVPKDVFELDGLKQKLYNLYPGGEKYAHLQRGISSIADSIKSTINTAQPEYAAVMGKYGDAMDLIQDMRNTLSQKPTAMVSTQMNKLRNAFKTTPEGERTADIINQITDANGRPIMASLAGQRLASWLPGHGPTNMYPAIMEGAAGLYAYRENPHLLPYAIAAAPAFSPRLVGEGAYGAGAAGRYLGQAVDALPVAPLARAGVQVGRPLQALQAARARGLLEPPSVPEDNLDHYASGNP